MTYKIFDLLQSFIDIENMSLKLYLKIEEHFKNESQEISILAKTIAKQEQKHIEYYESLSSSLKGKLMILSIFTSTIKFQDFYLNLKKYQNS